MLIARMIVPGAAAPGELPGELPRDFTVILTCYVSLQS